MRPLTPIRDVDRGLRAIAAEHPAALAIAGLACVGGWWLYVPVHELLHAFACMATGGTVGRLEIDGMYGAALLQRVFPFVAVGSGPAYAGRLAGFDTHGSDLIYLATDAAPFLLTIFIGVPLLEWVPGARLPWAWRASLLGIVLPAALGPFLSITGDYYEMGSIVVSRVAAIARPGFDVERWRSDDVIALAISIARSGSLGFGDVVGIGLGALLGAALAFTTYWLGRAWPRCRHRIVACVGASRGHGDAPRE